MVQNGTERSASVLIPCTREASIYKQAHISSVFFGGDYWVANITPTYYIYFIYLSRRKLSESRVFDVGKIARKEKKKRAQSNERSDIILDVCVVHRTTATT